MNLLETWRRAKSSSEAVAVRASSRNDELDSLRGIAAVGVVIYHIRSRELFWYWTSMDMFFILSSFLIGRLIEKKISTPREIPAFYVRRAQRLWPAYFWGLALLLLCFLVFSATGWGPQHGLSAMWRYATFSQYTEYYYSDTLHYDYPEYGIPLWSLAVEEHFYILYPAVYLLLRRLNVPLRILALCGGAALGLAARLQGFNFYLMVHHLDAFMAGAALSMAYGAIRKHPGTDRIFLVVGALALAALLPYFIDGYAAYLNKQPFAAGGTHGDHAIEAALFNVFWLCVIGWLSLRSGSSSTRHLRLPLFVYLGRLSYSLYLVHLPVLYLVGVLVDETLQRYLGLHLHHLAICAIALPFVFLTAHMLYVFVDRKCQESGSGPIIAAEQRVGGQRPQADAKL